MENPLSQKIGIIGGGQLGKMMIQAAKQMGFWVAILDPAKDCPAHSLCDRHIVATFDDREAIRALSCLCDVITYEFEHIDADTLIELVSESNAAVYPAPSTLKTIQNKFHQKRALSENGINVPEFVEITSVDDIHRAGEAFGYPLMLKAATGGYDGKGNYVIHGQKYINEAYSALGGRLRPLMAEKMVDFQMEVSVLACRGLDGAIKVFPVGRNTHYNNILDETLVPAPIAPDSMEAAMNAAYKVMDIFQGVGVFCVEMFVEKNGSILVNEVAPRPHNSGHYTIEACITSQFEQHIRAIAGLPLGDTALIRPVVMRNLLGEMGHDGKAQVTGSEEALKIPGAKLHIYGKTQTKPRRKMGHITVTAETAETAAALCGEAKECIKIVSEKEKPWEKSL